MLVLFSPGVQPEPGTCETAAQHLKGSGNQQKNQQKDVFFSPSKRKISMGIMKAPLRMQESLGEDIHAVLQSAWG